MQRKRKLKSTDLEIFDLGQKVRLCLDESLPSQRKLIKFFPRKTVFHYVHTLYDSTLKPNKLDEDDSKTLEELNKIAEKQEIVKNRAIMMQTWIEREDQLALKNLEEQIQNSEQTLNSEQTQIQDISIELSEQPQQDSNISERKSLFSSYPKLSSVELKEKKLEQQKKLLEERKKEIKTKDHDHLTPNEMEKYLWRTTQYIETLFDDSLDPTGKPWSFEEIIYGDIHEKRSRVFITSPWSGRIIKPIIRQDFESEPLKLSLLMEIERRQHIAQPEWIAPSRFPIEYKYLRPYMINQIHQLLTMNFWPGININESLLYPEYTIVAMYKELVIGCGFITEFGYITYLCVHPEWRNSGIGKFMLYHLIQTCPNKDITLHVSTNNPAMILYQKFCFKIDGHFLNFYQKYIPSNSNLSKHALFLRLKK